MIANNAIYSPNREHRYMLSRVWDHSKPICMFIMFNPCITDEHYNSAVINKVIEFAKSWGFGGIYVGNLFSRVSKDPKKLLEHTNDLFNIETRIWLRKMSSYSSIIILSWGNRTILESIYEKQPEVRSIIPDTLLQLSGKLCYIELSVLGVPKHPLNIQSGFIPQLLESYNQIKT